MAATQAELDAAKALLDAEEASKHVKVTFDDAQQKRIDELIREAQGRASKDLRTELEATKAAQATAQTELAAAKEALTKAKTPGQKAGAKEDIEILQNEIAEMKRVQEVNKQEREDLRKLAERNAKDAVDARTEAMNDKKRVAISSAAGDMGFFDPEAMVTLTSGSVKYNDELGRYVVLNEQGVERKNSSMEPMTLAEYFADLGNQKKWMVRGDVKPGAGSTTGSGIPRGTSELDLYFGPNAAPKAKHELAKKDIERYRTLRDQAMAKGYKF